MSFSNQGRETSQLLKDVDPIDLRVASTAARDEAYNHAGEASCPCVAIETLAVLYELGYRVTKEK